MLKRLEISGFKSFARKTVLDFSNAATAIVGPNGSGKSNVAEAFRFALGEQSMKSMRGKRSEDLIFAGSNQSPRANRAGVAIVFDNRAHGTDATKRTFPRLDFDEVTIERAVYRSGESEYSINGSKVRLRDVQELLASANVGETGHHIISQGEADRILLAHPRERRSMLEDALGLKVFEFKKQEAERKLEKTEVNVHEVESLRRELAPHIRFLKKQVERVERAEELTHQLAAVCIEYFSREDAYLATEKARATNARDAACEKLASAEAKLKAFDERTGNDVEGLAHAKRIREAESELDRALAARAALARDLGRVEGALGAARRASIEVAQEKSVKILREDLTTLRDEIERQGALSEDATPAALRAAVLGLLQLMRSFFDRFTARNDDYLAPETQSVFSLEGEQEALQQKDATLLEAVELSRSNLMRAREESLAYDEAGREQRHQLVELAQTRANQEAEMEREEAALRAHAYAANELMREKREALALAGSRAVSYDVNTALSEEPRSVQIERKRDLDRLKIRVEEAGGTGEDVRTEYDEAVAREAFLARELEDLAKSAEGLRTLISDLDTELQKTFNDGLVRVNASFGEFFSLMFGGGSAKLVLEDVRAAADEDDDFEENGAPVRALQKAGIEISVNLPKKRVQALMQLSGGERALTSIALIFAMSQVNPPPFLILDETDAALDEANSRRYGDMIEALAKKSQLIVISHNRETMSRAGILYGVTMGNDGISKLLSLRFEEAAQVAK